MTTDCFCCGLGWRAAAFRAQGFVKADAKSKVGTISRTRNREDGAELLLPRQTSTGPETGNNDSSQHGSTI